jgi:Kef-type K+ transport system membrane component KefB
MGVTIVAFYVADVGVGEGGELAMLTGFVLLAASVGGALAVQFNLPRITGYIVVGILAGPSVLSLIPASAVENLRLIDEFALALIAMLAGGEIKARELRPAAKTLTFTTLAVVVVVWLGVAVAVLAVSPLLPFLDGLPFSATVGLALLLGVWAANSSPDLTIGVIEETGARGKLSEAILGTTIIKDIVVIVLFTLVLSLVAPLMGIGEGGFEWGVLLEIAQEFGGAIALGAGLGIVFSHYLGEEEERTPFATFLFAYVLIVIVHRLHVELMLTAITAGFVIENVTVCGDQLIRGIKSVSVVIFAFFFTVAGAGLELGAVGAFWIAALVIFGARLLFTYLGAHLGMRLAGAEGEIRERTWKGLISQGGVTLGLVVLIESAFPQLGPEVVALGMAVILGNILIGPVMLKAALPQTSELADSGGVDDEGGIEHGR